MSYALVLPPELLRDLALIRKQTEESIRSLALEGIENHCKSIIGGMEIMHGKEHVAQLYINIDSDFKGE